MTRKMEQDWYIYLVRTGKGSLYTGITTDVARRFAEHEASGARAARSLRGRGPLSLVYSEKVGSRSNALKAEWAVKRLPKAAKEGLVAGDARLDELAQIPCNVAGKKNTCV